MKKKKVSTLIRVLKEIALPSLVAFLYVAFPSIQEMPIMKKIGIAAVGFTAIMFIQEQLQRVLKQEHDRRAFQETLNSFQELYIKIEMKFLDLNSYVEGQFGSVKEAIQDMYRLGQPVLGDENILPDLQYPPIRDIDIQASPTNDESKKIRFRTTDAASTLQTDLQDMYRQRDLLSEAKKTMQNGALTAALLVAGLAFENALRHFAEANKIIPQRGLASLLRQLQQILPDNDLEQFRALVTIRNRLAHAGAEDLPTQVDAEGVLDRYEWAINLLNRMINEGELITRETKIEDIKKKNNLSVQQSIRDHMPRLKDTE